MILIAGRDKLSRMIRLRTKAVLGVALLLGLAVVIVQIMRPGALRYLLWKTRTAVAFQTVHFQPGTISSAASRALEALNIYRQELEEENILWGQGLGGWFSDKYYPYAHSLMGGFHAYPDEQIIAGKLFQPHGTPIFTFLKMGIGGLLCYYFLMALIFKEGFGIFRKVDDRFWKAIALAILVFLPLLFYKNYISKLQVTFGIVLGILANIRTFGYKNLISYSENQDLGTQRESE